MLLTVLKKKKKIPAVKPGLTAGIVLSLLVGLLCYYITGRIIENDNKERFVTMAQNAQYTINARIKSYTDALRASASLFQTSEEVSREQFRRFVAGLALTQQFPAIEAINFVRWVTDEERDAFEAQVRREGALANDGRPEFKITPPGRRPTYSIVLYIEPNPFWRHSIGTDLNTQPLVYKALMESRDSGVLATSGAPIKAMQERHRVGLGMRLPVYRPGASLRTVEERRAAYIGSVGIAFNVERLVKGVLDEMAVEDVRLTLFNQVSDSGGVPATAQLLYDSNATGTDLVPTPTAEEDMGKFHVELPIDFNGRKWDAYFSVPKRALYRNADQSFLWVALIAGFTSTMLLYGLYYILTSSRQRAIELANGMTRELRESQAQLMLSHENLRRLSAHAESIKESERKRIAREIHDDLGQNLLALRIDAQLLFSRTTSSRHPRLHARAASNLEQIDATIKSVRQIINDLRPNVLDLGLNAAVSWQITEFRRRTGIECELIEHQADIVVCDHCATALFRILQESLSNVVRHAHASKVRVDLRVEGDWVWMNIYDNGVGLHPSRVTKSDTFGLIGIEERVKILDGKFSITGSPDRGTTITVAIPAQVATPQHTYEQERYAVPDFGLFI